MVPSDLIVIGVGELGGLFSIAALKLGIRVTPIIRDAPHPVDWASLPPHTPILLAVGEDALAPALGPVPAAHRDDVILLQNELFPPVWQQQGVLQPTVLIPWFSKKKGRPVEVGRPSLVHGRHADLLTQLHGVLGIPCQRTDDEHERNAGLAAKYTFILTINALGLLEDLTLGGWLAKDTPLIERIIDDARVLAEFLLGEAVDPQLVRAQVLEGMRGLKDYPARGRTAAARVARAARVANERGVRLGTLPHVLKDLWPTAP